MGSRRCQQRTYHGGCARNSVLGQLTTQSLFVSAVPRKKFRHLAELDNRENAPAFLLPIAVPTPRCKNIAMSGHAAVAACLRRPHPYSYAGASHRRRCRPRSCTRLTPAGQRQVIAAESVCACARFARARAAARAAVGAGRRECRFACWPPGEHPLQRFRGAMPIRYAYRYTSPTAVVWIHCMSGPGSRPSASASRVSAARAALSSGDGGARAGAGTVGARYMTTTTRR